MSKELPPVKKNKSPMMRTLKWIAVVAISLLLVLYFIFSSVASPESSILVGKVNGKPIYYSRDSAYARNYQRISDSINMQEYSDEARQMLTGIIEYQAFATTVNNILMYNVAKKNIEISDQYLLNNIKSYFIGDYGQFLEEEYNNFVATKSAVEKKIIEQDIRESVSLHTLGHELFQTIKTSPKLVEAEFAKRNNKRSVEIVYADARAMLREYVPTEAELRMYFSENAPQFTQADISWIVTSSTSEATLIYDTLKNDISYFAQMAIDKSEDEGNKADGGKVGKLTKQEMPSIEMGEVIFATNTADALLEPIVFEGMYYIIMVHSIETPSSMDMVTYDIVERQYLYNYDSNLLAQKKSELKEQLTNDANNTNGLPENSAYTYYALNDYHYGSTALDSISSTPIPFASDKIFSDTVFKTAVGSTSDVIEIPEGVAIIRVVSENKVPLVAAADATDEERIRIEQSLFEVQRDVLSQKPNILSNIWAAIAFANAKVEYKLSR